MKRLRSILLASFLLGPPTILPAQVRDSALARELVARGVADQAIRDTVIQAMQAGSPADPLLIARMNAVDSANLGWLKTTVAARGWPGRSLVGSEASHYAFLIAQHAVQDTLFQARVLGLMEQGIPQQEVDGQDFALLSDRMAVQRGLPQQFGTQARLDNRRIIFHPILDSANVDERRRKIGLVPLAAYARQLDSLYDGTHRP
jgi:hypothetical protein